MQQEQQGDIMTVWVCEKCAREKKRDHICMTKRPKERGPPPSGGGCTLEDGTHFVCDRADWVRTEDYDE